MTLCCHVIVADTDFKYIFLTHADGQTDLGDEKYGLTKWLEVLREKVNGDFGKIKVYVGDGTDKETESYYAGDVEEIVEKFKNKYGINNNILVKQSKQEQVYIVRGTDFRTGGIFEDQKGKDCLAGNKNVGKTLNLAEKMTPYYDGITPFSMQCISNYIRRDNSEVISSPIWFFDGTNFITEKELRREFPERDFDSSSESLEEEALPPASKLSNYDTSRLASRYLSDKNPIGMQEEKDYEYENIPEKLETSNSGFTKDSKSTPKTIVATNSSNSEGSFSDDFEDCSTNSDSENLKSDDFGEDSFDSTDSENELSKKMEYLAPPSTPRGFTRKPEGRGRF